MDRRVFTKKLLATVTSYALLESVFAHQAFAPAIKPITNHWAVRLHEYCADLKKQSISPTEWQDHVEQLFNNINIQDVIQFIDFERLMTGFSFPDLGVNTKPVRLPKLSGLPENTAFVRKIFGMKKDRAIIPHGHSNMASAHLVLRGEMHLRHYEKIRQEERNLIIKPTIDRSIGLGESSSISDEKDNVHWFVANTETAFTFDVIVLDIGDKHYDIQNIDIYASQNLSDGTLRAPILDVATALKRYGKETHH